MKIDKQRILGALDAVRTAQGVLTDDQAAECPALYPDWNGEGKEYEGGDRVLYEGTLYKCNNGMDHTSQPDWNPAVAASLWSPILPGQDGTAVGEWQQPGSENGYHKGDRVTHNGKLWESTIEDSQDGKGINVWEPGVYGWIEVVES